MINVRSDIQKQNINNNVKMKCGGLFELHLLLSIGTGTNYDKLNYGVSVKVVTFESGSSQEPRQTTTSVIDRLSQTTISQLSLQT
jgi:tRNA C32,U32 (ribose-2'-O)-methylase TrmJ